MRNGGALYWLLGDHLGSTAYTVSGTTESGEVRYKAFGATRFTSGATPTTFRYTGQREEAGLGLYYYGARWYDPALGHFIQPDTLVPDASNGLDYHRYAYTRFNPLKYNDPTGHCPAPPQEYANAICVAGFIPTKESEGAPGGLIVYQADDRGFSIDSTGQSSRFYLWIDADTGQFIGDPKAGVHSTIQLFPSHRLLGGGEHRPRDGYNTFTAQRFEDGTIYLSYSVVCAGPGCALAPGPEGEIYFKPNASGSFDTIGSVEAFPNLEAYHWSNGELVSPALFQLQNFSQEELTTGRARFKTGLNMVDWNPWGRRTFRAFTENTGQGWTFLTKIEE
jgi:RHS repeat-associated protein